MKLKPRLRWQLRGWRFSQHHLPVLSGLCLTNALPVDLRKLDWSAKQWSRYHGGECDYNGSSSGGGETTSSGETYRILIALGVTVGEQSSQDCTFFLMESTEFQAARFTHLNVEKEHVAQHKELIDPVDPVVLGTKMPPLDDDAESLVLGFERNRVHASSSKNPIITARSRGLAWTFWTRMGGSKVCEREREKVQEGERHSVLHLESPRLVGSTLITVIR